MPVFQNLDGTTSSEFQIGKTNPIKFRTNGGYVEYCKSDGIWKRLFSEIVDEPTGFPNWTDSTLSFVDGATPSFAINPTGATFDYFINGRLHSVGSKSVSPTIAEGIWYFYLNDAETLVATQTFSLTVLQNAIVASGYWDNTNQVWILKCEERHGLTMDAATHWDLHESFGTTYISGLGLGNFSIQAGAPTNDAAGQFSAASGVIRDEDNRFILGGSANPAVLPVFYQSGASGIWRRQAANNIPVVYNGGTGLLRYNQFTGGAWQQTDVTSGNFTLIHVFATNDTAQPYIVIQGQAQYNTANAAKEGATTELKTLVLAGLPTVEFSAIATVIYQTNSGWTNNAKHCKVVEYTTGVSYVDWRRVYREPSTGGGVTAVGDHETLTGLLGGATNDHYHYTLAQHDFLLAAASFVRTTDPTVNDDSGDGYLVNNIWINSTGKRIYVCTDTTVGAAVWVPLAEVIADLTPQLGGDLDVNGKKITSVSDGDVQIQPHGTGSVDLGGKKLKEPKLQNIDETLQSLGSISGATAIDYRNGEVVTATIGGATTFSITNPKPVCNVTMFLTNAGTNVTWMSGTKWDGGATPTDLAASGLSIVSFGTVDGGTTWHGVVSSKDSK